MRKFFYYVYARYFTLITDHKPLTQILHPEKSLPVLCISRMANYADNLAHFDYNVIFNTTKANANADYCSRAPLPSTVNTIQGISFEEGEKAAENDEFDQFILGQVRQLPVLAEQIAQDTRKDSCLGKIVQAGQSFAGNGYVAPELHYNLASNCLIFEHRVVVPPSLRQPILDDRSTRSPYKHRQDEGFGALVCVLARYLCRYRKNGEVVP